MLSVQPIINRELKKAKYGKREECSQVAITSTLSSKKRDEEKERKYQESTELADGLYYSNPTATTVFINGGENSITVSQIEGDEVLDLCVSICVYERNNQVRGCRQINLEKALLKVLENLGNAWIWSTICLFVFFFFSNMLQLNEDENVIQ